MTYGASDLDLAERAARGDGAATTELVNRVLPIVRGLARRLSGDPEEGDALAQEAIVTALEGIHRYRGEAAFATWVCGIAVRRHAELKRREIAERRRLQRLQHAHEPDPSEVVAASDTEHRLWSLIQQLPLAHREVLIARATSESTTQAAGGMGVTANAFRVRLHRARLALRRLLMAQCPDLMEELRDGKG